MDSVGGEWVGGLVHGLEGFRAEDPCLWEESDHPAFGPPASLSLHMASTPAGHVHNSRGDSVVHMWMQLIRWCVDVAEGA